MQEFERLEEEFGKWSQTKNVVACSSGTSALHLALEAFRFPLGSEVIVPEFTMVACARAVTMAGLVPKFVDCGDDLNINPELLEGALTANTAAIMAVHIYGRRCDMDAISAFAIKHGLVVIEDLAEAHGVPVHKTTDAACWSFYQNKIVAGEEGGAIAFKESHLANYARELRSVGFTHEHNFLHHPRGFNARLSNANSELILESLKSADQNLGDRARVEAIYSELIPEECRMPPRDVVWVYDLKVINNTQPIQACCNQGVQARYGFKPMSQQSEYQRSYRGLNAYRLSKEVMYLPVYPDMQREDCERNVDILKAAIISG